VIKPLEKLKKIKELSLFNNQIFHSESTLEVFIGLPVLTTLSIDGNPVKCASLTPPSVILLWDSESNSLCV
jgi:Leucine-rich repeat (LRR) protein